MLVVPKNALAHNHAVINFLFCLGIRYFENTVYSALVIIFAATNALNALSHLERNMVDLEICQVCLTHNIFKSSFIFQKLSHSTHLHRSRLAQAALSQDSCMS